MGRVEIYYEPRFKILPGPAHTPQYVLVRWWNGTRTNQPFVVQYSTVLFLKFRVELKSLGLFISSCPPSLSLSFLCLVMLIICHHPPILSVLLLFSYSTLSPLHLSSSWIPRHVLGYMCWYASTNQTLTGWAMDPQDFKSSYKQLGKSMN